jgi:nucleoside-diphosphate-sugar epimerase
MRIAITGGSGRIGRAVIEAGLAQGHSLVSIDQVAPAQPEPDKRPGLLFLQADITHYAEIEQALKGCDGLIHLAAIPSPGHHPDHVVHNNNVTGSYNALSAAANLGITQVCQASSVNATGLSYSRWPRLDYFPLDEKHPTYNEDPYSLSKWICEQQADSFARLHANMTISSLRFSWVTDKRPEITESFSKDRAKNLWGYTSFAAAARACLLALTADFKGHEVFYITAPDTVSATPSRELAQEFFPEVPIRPGLVGNWSFFDCSKAERLLGWKHLEK